MSFAPNLGVNFPLSILVINRYLLTTINQQWNENNHRAIQNQVGGADLF